MAALGSDSGRRRSYVGVLLGAGRSDRVSRYGPSALQLLDGLPLIVHGARLLRGHPRLREAALVIAAPANVTADLRTALAGRIVGPAPRFVAADDSLDSAVHAALAVLEDQADPMVVLHDVRRPLATAELLARVVAGAERSGAAVPALDLIDTVKQLDGSGRVLRTLPREDLVRVQTPQAAGLAMLLERHADCRPSEPIASLVGWGPMVDRVAGEEQAMLVRDENDMALAHALSQA